MRYRVNQSAAGVCLDPHFGDGVFAAQVTRQRRNIGVRPADDFQQTEMSIHARHGPGKSTLRQLAGQHAGFGSTSGMHAFDHAAGALGKGFDAAGT